MRQPHDFYETGRWQTRALLANQPISGVVLEPCVGDGSIVKVLSAQRDITQIWTNDWNVSREADFAYSADDQGLYEMLGPVDWVITNPPFQMPLCRDIVALAVRQARKGVAMLLRISFREPTAKVNPRGPFLEQHPMSRLLTLPRYSYTGNGQTDSATTEWAIWIKQPALNLGDPILSLYDADRTYAKEQQRV